MRQPKQVRLCPLCSGLLKRVIGAQTRKKFWQCTKCNYRMACDAT